eukprot:9065058-Pyramimonas_sp.AAC.1
MNKREGERRQADAKAEPKTASFMLVDAREPGARAPRAKRPHAFRNEGAVSRRALEPHLLSCSERAFEHARVALQAAGRYPRPSCRV